MSPIQKIEPASMLTALYRGGISPSGKSCSLILNLAKNVQ